MGSAGVLCWLLQTPEMAELIAIAPVQAGRILRPLCHLLGVELAPGTLLPSPCRASRRRPPRCTGTTAGSSHAE